MNNRGCKQSNNQIDHCYKLRKPCCIYLTYDRDTFFYLRGYYVLAIFILIHIGNLRAIGLFFCYSCHFLVLFPIFCVYGVTFMLITPLCGAGSGSFSERKKQFSCKNSLPCFKKCLSRQTSWCLLLTVLGVMVSATLGSISCCHLILSRMPSSFVNCKFRHNFIVSGGCVCGFFFLTEAFNMV